MDRKSFFNGDDDKIGLPKIKIPLFFKLCFGFCLFLALAFMVGVVFVVYRLMVYFGI